jgi:hypothetical protein
MKAPKGAIVGVAMIAVPVLVLLFVALPGIVRRELAMPWSIHWWALTHALPAILFVAWWVGAAARLIDTGHLIARRVITDPCYPEGGPLFTRYYLFQCPFFALYVHHFHRSDNDRHVHDHPWTFVTWLLSRGYWEHVPELPMFPGGTQVRFWRARFSVLYRPAEWKHWVEIERPVWTLVLRLRRRREWGFWTHLGWIDWKTYGREWCD